MANEYKSPNEHRISMMMSDSSYRHLFPENTKKVDHRYVRLQQIEHELKENELLSQCLYAAVTGVFLSYIYIIIYFKEISFLEIAIRTIQAVGYTYGIQAFNKKNRDMAKVLVFFLWASFLLVPYLTAAYYYHEKGASWFNIIFNIILFFFNIFILFLASRYSKNLEERRRLMKALEKH